MKWPHLHTTPILPLTNLWWIVWDGEWAVMHNLLPREIWQRSTPTFWYVLPECMMQLQMLGRWLKCSTLFTGQGEEGPKILWPDLEEKLTWDLMTLMWKQKPKKFFYTSRTENMPILVNEKKHSWEWHFMVEHFVKRTLLASVDHSVDMITL